MKSLILQVCGAGGTPGKIFTVKKLQDRRQAKIRTGV
jgi:hypothetical protein